MSQPRLDILVVNFNIDHLLDGTFSAVSASQQAPLVRLLCVDNASTDGAIQVFKKKHSNIYLEANKVNIGFGCANSQLIPQIQGDSVLLLNTNIFVTPNTLEKTIAHMQRHPDCGVLGVRLIGRDGQLQPSCRYFPTLFNLCLLQDRPSPVFPLDTSSG